MLNTQIIAIACKRSNMTNDDEICRPWQNLPQWFCWIAGTCSWGCVLGGPAATLCMVGDECSAFESVWTANTTGRNWSGLAEAPSNSRPKSQLQAKSRGLFPQEHLKLRNARWTKALCSAQILRVWTQLPPLLPFQFQFYTAELQATCPPCSLGSSLQTLAVHLPR